MVSDIHNEISEKFQQAESIIKELESMHDEGTCIPAINELRYCGRHLVDSFTCDDDKIDETYEKAKGHCCRAIYDASEASYLASIKKHDNLKEKYQHVSLIDVVPNYIEILKGIIEAKRYIGKQDKEVNKEVYYETLYNLSVRTYEGILTMEAMEEELKKKERSESTRKNQDKGNYHTNIVRFIGFIVMVIVSAVSYTVGSID